MFQHVFIPAIVNYVMWEGRGIPFHWLEPGWPHYYPAVLFSYAFWRDVPVQVRDNNGIMVFGDSGGYTVVTKGNDQAKIDPVSAIRWQIKRCTRGVILDLPPYVRASSNIQFSGAALTHWDDSIAGTQRNIERALPYYEEALREGKAFRWWGVLQGETTNQITEWYDMVRSVYPFEREGEGWALAPKPSTDMVSNARYLRFARENGLRNIHILQVTSAKVVGLVMALAKMSGAFDLITYDSATAARCAINRNAILTAEDGLGMTFIKQFGMEGVVEDLMQKCPCQACAWYREHFQEPPVTNAEYPHIILLHNHLKMIETFDRLYEETEKDAEAVLQWACGGQQVRGTVLREFEGAHEMAKRQSKPLFSLTAWAAEARDQQVGADEAD